jgi:hypothetical protein
MVVGEYPVQYQVPFLLQKKTCTVMISVAAEPKPHHFSGWEQEPQIYILIFELNKILKVRAELFFLPRTEREAGAASIYDLALEYQNCKNIFIFKKY